MDKLRTIYYPGEDPNNKYTSMIIDEIRENNILVEGYDENLLKNKKYDVINLNWFENIMFHNKIRLYYEYLKKVRFLYYLKHKGIKIIWTVHNKIPHENNSSKIILKLMKKLSQMSDRIIIHCRETVNVLKKINPKLNLKKISFVPHPNYIDVYDNKNINFRKMLNINNEDMVFLFVGQLRMYKNIELLLDISKKFKNRENIKFIIAGKPYNDEYKKKLLKMVEGHSNVKLICKFINDDELTSLIDSSDILILPYNTQSSLNSGTVILAFSMGKNVICPNIGTIKEIRDKNILYSYDYNSKEEHIEQLELQVRKCINDFKNDKDEFINKGKKLKKIMVKENNHSLVSKRYGEIYKDIMSNCYDSETIS